MTTISEIASPFASAEKRNSSAPGINWAFAIAWGFCLIFYFTQYAVRSAPSVMLPELTEAFSLSVLSFAIPKAISAEAWRESRRSLRQRWLAK